MKMHKFAKILAASTALMVIAGAAVHPTSAFAAAPGAAAKQKDKVILMSVGRGEQINLSTPITDVYVANSKIANADTRNSRQLYIYAVAPGETTIYATDAAGRTVYSATIRVGNNIETVDQMLQLAMPEADIKVSTMNGLVLLTGTVRQPEDIVEAEKLVQAYVGQAMTVVSRLKTATPMQVNLQVRIAEVSRSLSKDISSNLSTRDNDGASGNGFLFVPSRGRQVATFTDTRDATGAVVGTTVNFVNPAGGNVLNMAKNLFGIDMALGLDFAERSGLATTLAQPNLTTISGEAAQFLAGGQFPFPSSAGLGTTAFEFKNFGVGLEYTPTVLSDGRILLKVRPEVSDISSSGSLRVNGAEVPSIITRSAETTVVLGSGQSFMIAGLLQNSAQTSIDKFPGLGDVPVLGTLFKSNGWRRNETELVIIVTPYLVKPVSESEIKLPTDGFNAPSDLERILLNKTSTNVTGPKDRPMPTVAPDAPSGPQFGSIDGSVPALPKAAEQPKQAKAAASGGPGFSFE